MLQHWRLPLALLSGSQAFSQTAVVFLMTLSSVAGAFLSPQEPALATLPIAAVVLGTALGLIPAAGWMARFGRLSGFRYGVLFGLAGALLALAGLATRNLWLFTAGHLLMGFQQGAFQYLRFAASEIVPEANRSQGISLVLAGGVVAAVLGPWLAHVSRSLGLELPWGLAFLPIFLVYVVMAVLFAVMPRLDEPKVQTAAAPPAGPPARPLLIILTQPAYLQALLGSLVGSALMILLMTATPLNMAHHGHSSADTSWVIQWHVLGMFVPSFFTGSLIKRFGHRPILALGLLCLILDAVSALLLTGLIGYWVPLTLLGLGWNFLYIGSSSRLVGTYHPAEKEKAQAAHDLLVYAANTLATYTSAALLQSLGWINLHLWIFPLLAVTALVILLPKPKAKPAT